MKYFNKLIVCAVFISLFPVSSVLAEQRIQVPERGPVPFAAYDTDADGFITQAEFDAVRSARAAMQQASGRPAQGMGNAPTFQMLDVNADNRLTADELAIGQRVQMGAGQGRGNGQGMRNTQAKNMPAFSDYDLNADGGITQQEFNSARGARITERAQQGYMMKNLANAPSFMDVDTDANGVISSDEFAAHQMLHRNQVQTQ